MNYSELFDWISQDIRAHYARLCYRQKEFQEFLQERDNVSSAKTAGEFSEKLNKTLWKLRDNHIRVRLTNGKTLKGYPRELKPNYSWEYCARLFKTKPDRVKHATLLYKRINSKTLYLLINSFSKNRINTFMREAPKLREKLGITENVIIDVRPNQGGSDKTGSLIWSLFLPKGEKKLARVLKYRANPRDPNEFYEYEDYIHGTEEKALKPKKLLVLCGQQTESSAEGFVLRMKAIGATVLGDRTGGTSGRPLPHVFGPVEVDIPSWIPCESDRTPIFDRGVQPHIKIDPEKAPTTPEEDPTLEKALETTGR